MANNEKHYVVWYAFVGGMTYPFRCKATNKRSARKMFYDYWAFFGGHKRDDFIVYDVELED